MVLSNKALLIVQSIIAFIVISYQVAYNLNLLWNYDMWGGHEPLAFGRTIPLRIVLLKNLFWFSFLLSTVGLMLRKKYLGWILFQVLALPYALLDVLEIVPKLERIIYASLAPIDESYWENWEYYYVYSTIEFILLLGLIWFIFYLNRRVTKNLFTINIKENYIIYKRVLYGIGGVIIIFLWMYHIIKF